VVAGASKACSVPGAPPAALDAQGRLLRLQDQLGQAGEGAEDADVGRCGLPAPCDDEGLQLAEADEACRQGGTWGEPACAG
jgi:hypothetical protein